MVKVGLVGYGFMGKMHSQCYLASGGAEIAAVADVEPDRRKAAEAALGCKTFETVQDLVRGADVDVVDVCTPTYCHEEGVIEAARAGRDIFCEKPMSLSLQSCDRMIRAVRSAGVKLMVGQVLRFWPEYQVVKETVDSGKYGAVRWLSANRQSAVATYAWQDWLADPARSGGAVLDLHVHDQDFITYLIGAPKRIQSRAVPGHGGGLDSVLALGWGHRGGASSFAEGTLALAPGYPFRMSLLVACEKATIRYDSALAPTLMVYPVEAEPFAPELPAAPVGESNEAGGNIAALGGYFNEIKYFVECVKSGRHPEVVTPESAREAVRLCLAAARSAETGEAVEV